MSKHWSAIEIMTADTIWEFVDEQMQCLRSMEEEVSDDTAGTIYKLLLRGRVEMLDTFCKVLMNQTVSLGEMVIAHGIVANSDIEEL